MEGNPGKRGVEVETKGGGHVGRNLVNGEQLEETDAPCRCALPALRSHGFHACFSHRFGDFLLPLSPFFKGVGGST